MIAILNQFQMQLCKHQHGGYKDYKSFIFKFVLFMPSRFVKLAILKSTKTQTFVVVDDKATYFCIKFPDIFFKSIEFMIIYDNSYRIICDHLYRITV